MTVRTPSKVTIKSLPYGDIEVDTDSILCNDITFPGEYNPHNTRLWIIEIGHGYHSSFSGVWSNCEQDALDEAADQGLLDNLLLGREDQADRTDHEDDCPKPESMDLYDWYSENNSQCCNYSENFAHLGNAGEPFDLDNVGIRPVDLTKQDQSFMMLLAEARGARVDKLSDL